MKRSKFPLVLLLLICLVLHSSCTLLGGGPKEQKNQANKGDKTSQSNQTDKSAENYLKAVGPTFKESIEKFQVFDEYSVDNLEEITKALDMVKNSKSQFQSWLKNAQNQPVPDQPIKIPAFHSSLILYYNDSIDIMGDYEQILKYSADLYKSLEPIEKAVEMSFGGTPSLEEVLAVVENLRKSIIKSTEDAKKCAPPHYMAYSHADYVSILTKYSGATDDLAYALRLVDPLRINAAMYRYDLLANKLKIISDEMDADIEKQQVKMNELISNLKNSQDDLSAQLSNLLDEYKINN